MGSTTESETERSPQEELEKIYLVLDNLLDRRAEGWFNFDFPEDAGLRFVIQRGRAPDILRVSFNPSGRQHIRLAFNFTKGTGITELEVDFTKIIVENEGKRLTLARTMLNKIQERTNPKAGSETTP